MTNRWQCYLLKLKNKICQYLKRLFLIPEGQMHQNQSACFHFYATVLLKQLNTHATKYMAILQQLCIVITRNVIKTRNVIIITFCVF